MNSGESLLIGSLPEEWSVQKIKYVFDERKETNNPVKTDVLVSLTHDRGVILHSEKGNIGNKEKDDLTKYKLVYPDDLVVNSMNVIIGSSGISKFYGLVSPVYYMLKTKDPEMDTWYFHYLFRSILFQKSLIGVGNGILEHRMRVPMDKLGSHRIPLPPSQEQKLISRFLDKKTEQIDSLVEKIQKKIELLKEQRTSLINQCVTKGLDPNVEMEDSGVEWIGEIPKHWKKIRLKYLVTINSGFAFKSSEYTEEGVQVIKIGNLYQNKLDLTRSPSYLDSGYLESHPGFVVRLGDLLISLTGTLGKRDYGFVCRYEQDNLSLLNQRVGRLVKNSPDIMDEFLEYSLTSESFLSQLFRRPTGTKQGNLSNDDVLLNYLWLPPIETQLEICSYLDSKLHDLDNSQRLYEIKIDLIGEYRQSLISSVVTGKVHVTEDMI